MRAPSWRPLCSLVKPSPTRCRLLSKALRRAAVLPRRRLRVVEYLQVDKQGAKWYTLSVTQQHLDAGFVISAYSASASKFKLLLFERTPEGVNELAAQVLRLATGKSSAAPQHLADIYAGDPRRRTLSSSRRVPRWRVCTSCTSRRAMWGHPLLCWSCLASQRQHFFGDWTTCRSVKYLLSGPARCWWRCMGITGTCSTFMSPCIAILSQVHSSQSIAVQVPASGVFTDRKRHQTVQPSSIRGRRNG